MTTPLFSLKAISKTYPGVVALSDVSLSVQAGEVLGLIGENGAGKSTLMKILGGVVPPSAGRIVIDGEQLSGLSVTESIRRGIAFVHQELNLFENLSVGANIYVGHEPRRPGLLRLLDQRRIDADTLEILRRLRVDFRPSTLVEELSLAQMQMVEIAKALALRARVIIMDEPSSSLSLTETENLLRVIGELRQSGVSVIYISHRLGEVSTIADRVVCLRDGRVVGQLTKGEIHHDAMVRMMIGRDLQSLYTPPQAPPGPPVCRIRQLRTAAYPGKEVSLDIRQGEILGIAGLVGSGRTELGETIFGISPALSGTVELDGQVVRVQAPNEAIALGIYLVPEDRKRSGLVLEMPIYQNITLPDLATYSRYGLIRPERERSAAEAQRDKLRIKSASTSVEVTTLSGGNQQKVVLAKWTSMRPRLIIFDEPTRGVDVGAKSEIYSIMRRLADDGVAIVMISSEMEEVIGVSDRIAVMSEGQISGFLERQEFSEQNVMTLAVGGGAGDRSGFGGI